MPQAMRHRWTRNDDILAYYLYRIGKEFVTSSETKKIYVAMKNRIAEIQKIKVGSLNMRIQNFQALDGNGGLNNWAKISAIIYNEFRAKSLSEIQDCCSDIITMPVT